MPPPKKPADVKSRKAAGKAGSAADNKGKPSKTKAASSSKTKPAPRGAASRKKTGPKDVSGTLSPQFKGGFPVVGIGASAGGLEAFEQFFVNMPPDSGMAFVLITHLDPTHKSIMGDLLRRYTKMPVYQVEKSVELKSNNVYIIPPNKDLVCENGRLVLINPVEQRGHRHPIDIFMRSLAEDQGERAICIILSGTGTDGTLGLKAVKGTGGMVMVQDTASAKYNGMPYSAISTDLVDFVMPPEKMPEQLIRYVQKSFDERLLEQRREIDKPSLAMQRIFSIIRSGTGHDFSLYKQNTIVRRIERRMAVNQLESMIDYSRYLQENPLEVQSLVKEMLIGVTNFFRDPDVFASLNSKAVLPIIEQKPKDQPVRIWTPGCSTGEEAFSIAMLFREAMDKVGKHHDIQVFATDIDESALEKARVGVYPDSISTDVSPARLKKFFVKLENHYQVKKELRETVVFAVQDLIKDPPFSKLDLISCRNLLIYMGSELQRKVLPLFHYTLMSGGYLLLGTSETIGEFSNLFNVLDKKNKIFQKALAGLAQQPGVDFSTASVFQEKKLRREDKAGKQAAIMPLPEMMERALLSSYAPPAVIIDEKCNILFVYGHTARFIELAPGEPTNNLLSLVKEEVRLEMHTVIRKAVSQKVEANYDGLRLKNNGGYVVFNLRAKPLDTGDGGGHMFLVVFEEMFNTDPNAKETEMKAGSRAGAKQVRELERELKTTKEYLQSTIEELETSNEELKSSNEELQSSNEELQSTNEELETSKEELQSVNEELVTVNSELQNKIDELSKANNDINNLLSSTEIATIFLDEKLHIQRFTQPATQVINLIGADIGRPIGHIVTKLKYVNLVKDCEAVLDNLDTVRKEVSTQDGTWYYMKILPYRTVENVVEGVVVTFTNVSELRLAQEELRKFMIAVDQSPNIFMMMDTSGSLTYVNLSYTAITGVTKDDALGKEPRFFSRLSQKERKRMWTTLKSGNVWQGAVKLVTTDNKQLNDHASIFPLRDANNDVTDIVVVCMELQSCDIINVTQPPLKNRTE